MRGLTKSTSASGVPLANLAGPVQISWREEESRRDVERGLFEVNGKRMRKRMITRNTIYLRF